MKDQDLSGFLTFAIEKLKDHWVSPSCYSYRGHNLMLEQDDKLPKVWRLHVFNGGRLIYSVDFEPPV